MISAALLNAMLVFAFLCLPEDLQLAVIGFLDWPTLTSLRRTSKALACLIPTSRLPRHHATCKKQVQLDEFAILRLLHDPSTFPEGHRFLTPSSQCAKNDTTVHLALPSFPSNVTNLHTHPRHFRPTLRKASYLYYLPCYTCLRWLYAREPGAVKPFKSDRRSSPGGPFEDDPNDEPQFAERLRRSHDNCFAGKWRILPQQPYHVSHIPMERICITCGIRQGRYTRNVRVGGFQICALCGALESRHPRTESEYNTWPPSKGLRLCLACLTSPPVTQMSELQFRHELFWGRYERGIREGKRARVKEGIKRRAQLGLDSGRDEELLKRVDEAGTWCPMMSEPRFCCCHKQWTKQEVALTQDCHGYPLSLHEEFVDTYWQDVFDVDQCGPKSWKQ